MLGANKEGKLKLIKMKTSLNEDVEFKDIDINPLIKDFMFREAFNMFDENHSGEIDKREFAKLITSLGLELNEKRINELMKEMDKDGSGTIDFDEFSIMMSNFQFGKESQIQQHLENAFNDYDKDMDTMILPDDFKKVSEELDSIPMFITFCKHFGREKGIPSYNENAVSKEEFINALVQLNFLIESKNDGKSRTSTNVQNTNTNNTNTNINQSQSNLNPSERKQSTLNQQLTENKSLKSGRSGKSESGVGSKDSSSIIN